MQVQADRFLYNWKKASTEDAYPRFSDVYRCFEEELGRFMHFASDQQVGAVSPLQYELSYINHVELGEDLLATAAQVFRGYGGLDGEAPWSAVDSINWNTAFRLPKNAGRLHCSIKKAIRRIDNVGVLRFDLTARGLGSEEVASRGDWFSLAHDAIVASFEFLTTPDAHAEWGKQ